MAEQFIGSNEGEHQNRKDCKPKEMTQTKSDEKKFRGGKSAMPKDGDKCCFQFKQISGPMWKCQHPNSTVCANDFIQMEVTLGQTDSPVLCYLEKHLKTMNLAEKHIISFEAKTSLSCVDTADRQQYQFELELKHYEKCQEIWRLSATDKYRLAEKCKLLGVSLFKDKYVDLAFEKFSSALKLLICMLPESEIPPEMLCDYKKMKCLCYANISMCQLIAENYDFVVKNCTQALTLQPENVKCLYRRSLAYKSLKDNDKAMADLNSAHQLEPTNQAVIKEVNVVKRLLKEDNRLHSEICSKMFSS